VERKSEKHNPRVDEEMMQETASLVRGSPVEARAEEFREQEGPGDGEPTADVDLSLDEIEQRSELARHLGPAPFPGDRDSLLEAARKEYAPDAVIRQLESLPPGEQFENVQAVWVALGHETERRG
jgi:hypothetical protein